MGAVPSLFQDAGRSDCEFVDAVGIPPRPVLVSLDAPSVVTQLRKYAQCVNAAIEDVAEKAAVALMTMERLCTEEETSSEAVDAVSIKNLLGDAIRRRVARLTSQLEDELVRIDQVLIALEVEGTDVSSALLSEFGSTTIRTKPDIDTTLEVVSFTQDEPLVKSCGDHVSCVDQEVQDFPEFKCRLICAANQVGLRLNELIHQKS